MKIIKILKSLPVRLSMVWAIFTRLEVICLSTNRVMASVGDDIDKPYKLVNFIKNILKAHKRDDPEYWAEPGEEKVLFSDTEFTDPW